MRKILCKDKKEIELVNKVFKNCNYLGAKGKITLREEPHGEIAAINAFDDWHTEYVTLCPESAF